MPEESGLSRDEGNSTFGLSPDFLPFGFCWTVFVDILVILGRRTRAKLERGVLGSVRVSLGVRGGLPASW